MLKLKTMIVAGGVAAAAAAGMAIATPALADPPSGTTPAATDIVGVGSDTTQGVNDQFSLDYNASHSTGRLYSFDAVPVGSTITEKAGCAARTRPNGSGAGIAELTANLRPSGNSTNYCVDFARSSRARGTSDPSSIVFVEYALDAVTWSANRATSLPASLTTNQLKAIYTCDASLLGGGQSGPVTENEVGGKGNQAVVPVIPQSSSGTRAFFLASIGVTTLGSCVQGQDNSVEENEGTNPIFSGSDKRNVIFPYSVAVYLAQSQGGHGSGTQGPLLLEKVNGANPTQGKKGKLKISPKFPYQRKVYSVVRNASTNGGLAVPTYLQGVFGTGVKNSGFLCSSAERSTISSFGFGIDPNCGTLS